MSLGVLSNGKIGTFGDENEVEIWDSWTGTFSDDEFTKFSDDVSGFIEMANGEIVTQCYRNETILRIWDKKNGTFIRTLSLEIEKDTGIEFAFGKFWQMTML